mmetsp:Transcript_10529/g.29970  ORF Transcript_10529/g.29970 Transcript_10529/m.29970 type:complete len:329 (+) Transcript_10529:366-1352(+)
MCISHKAQQSNIMDGNSRSGVDSISQSFCESSLHFCDGEYFKSSIREISHIESSVAPIRTSAHDAIEPTPMAQKGAVQAVPSVETLPGKLKHYCEEYIAALSHLIPEDELKGKEAFQHTPTGPETLQVGFSMETSGHLSSNSPDESSWQPSTIASNPPCQSSVTADPSKRIHPYQQERWMDRYQDLIAFCQRHGHCNVPYVCEDNPCLGQWVKRQRHQYKLLCQGLHANLDESRMQALNMLGFIWDSHGAAWEEKYQELKQFYQLHMHTNVPCIYRGGSQLSTWIKRQRRQYRLYIAGKTSTMDPVRVSRLEDIGFVWDYYGKSNGTT